MQLFSLLRSRGTDAVFVHPLDPAPRTAILVGGFRAARSIRVFPEGWDDKVLKYAPQAIAGTFDQLISIGDGGDQITHAVICLSWSFEDLLSDQQRNMLWSAFGVPVFEQILGPGNVLLASGCEAHGLHITAAYSGPALDARCACGRLTPRAA